MFDALDLSKHNDRTNLLKMLHELHVVQFARVVEVLDDITVNAESVVRTALSREIFTITLLSLSSAYMETKIQPKIGDTVLVLFLQRYDPRMFSTEGVVKNPEALGYNAGAGVGLLMATAKQLSKVVLSVDEEHSGLNVKNNVYSSFLKSLSVDFSKEFYDDDDEQLISVEFGTQRPFKQEHSARVNRLFLGSVDEKYGESAPLSIESEADISVKTMENMEIEITKDATIKSDNLTLETTSKIEIKNTSQSLGAILDEFLDLVSTGLVSLAPSGTAPLNTAPQIGLLRTKLALLMET